MINFFATLLAKLSLNSAVSAAGAASNWNIYQPKEPAIIADLIK